jgi:hypothetical protein
MSFKKLFYSILLFVCLICVLQSCSLINPEIKVPAYIHIDKINLSTNYITEGTSSSKITDAWIYIDDKLIGAFELPATVPVLEEGNHKLSVRAGIKVSGISATRAYYPFYDQYIINVDLKPDAIDTINPTVNYFATSGLFHWMEDFEGGGITLMKYSTSDTIIDKTSDPQFVFEGNYSGIAYLTSSKPYLLSASIDNFVLPIGNNPVFLELNYKTNNRFRVGLYANGTTRIEVITVNTSETWNKIYVNFTPFVNTYSTASNFKIFLESYKEDDVETPILLFDNIKLIYF